MYTVKCASLVRLMHPKYGLSCVHAMYWVERCRFVACSAWFWRLLRVLCVMRNVHGDGVLGVKRKSLIFFLFGVSRFFFQA